MPNPSLSADNITTTGIRTLHFSIKPSTARPLNVSHEYLLVFLERGDFAGNQISLKTGTLIGSDGASKNNLVLLGNSRNGSKAFFSTPTNSTTFTNFAVKMDFGKKYAFPFSSFSLFLFLI